MHYLLERMRSKGVVGHSAHCVAVVAVSRHSITCERILMAHRPRAQLTFRPHIVNHAQTQNMFVYCEGRKILMLHASRIKAPKRREAIVSY